MLADFFLGENRWSLVYCYACCVKADARSGMVVFVPNSEETFSVLSLGYVFPASMSLTQGTVGSALPLSSQVDLLVSEHLSPLQPRRFPSVLAPLVKPRATC